MAIDVRILPRGKKWAVIIDDFVDDDHLLYPDNVEIGLLQEIIDWTIQTLETWPNVNRGSYDMWIFQKRRDAEKFTVLYNLKWAK